MRTQLPFVGIAGGSALVGYIVFSVSGLTWLGLVATLVVLAASVAVIRLVGTPVTESSPATSDQAGSAP